MPIADFNRLSLNKPRDIARGFDAQLSLAPHVTASITRSRLKLPGFWRGGLLAENGKPRPYPCRRYSILCSFRLTEFRRQRVYPVARRSIQTGLRVGRRPALLPKTPCDFHGINLQVFPPSDFIAGLVHLSVMTAA